RALVGDIGATGPDPLDDLPVSRVGEPLDDRGRDGGADALDGRELLGGRRGDRVDRPQLTRERLRRRRTYVADGQPDQQSPQWAPAGGIKPLEDLRDLLLAEPA